MCVCLIKNKQLIHLFIYSFIYLFICRRVFRSPCRRARWTRSAVFCSSEPTPELPTSTETQRNSPGSSTEPVEGECDVNGCDGAQRKHVLPAGCARRSNGSVGSVHRRRRRDECQQRRRHGTASGSQVQRRRRRRRHTALHLAAKNGHVDAVKLLLQKSRLDARNKYTTRRPHFH